MRLRMAALGAALFLLCGAGLSWLILRPDPAARVDLVALNRMVRGVEEHWDELERTDFSHFPYAFCVLDAGGAPIFRAGEAADSLWEAVGRGDAVLDIGPQAAPLGKMLVSVGLAQRMEERDRRLAALAAAMFFGCALLTGGYYLYLRRRVLLPFQRLRGFAARVASGNLDAPLQMDRGNLFGAFTESFDLMREELRRARARELAAQQEKKELVASLSHDIRTPVTSIQLLCELMQVTAPADLVPRLETIRAKADRIDGLVTNLFQATLEELGELNVHPQELDSRALARMLREADYLGRMEGGARMPDCVVRADPLRMEQVLDNLLANSYKYAGTSIQAVYTLTDEFLSVTLRDYGPGVGEDELPELTRKFYRGAGASHSGQEGSGLGLYLANFLMAQMDGDLSCRNEKPGFAIELLIPLA